MNAAEIINAFAAADEKLAPRVASGELSKAAVLTTFFALREEAHHFCPSVAELLVPTHCEAAVPPTPFTITNDE